MYAGVDQGRLNLARHGLLMCVRRVLNEQNVVYSMPTFRGGGGAAGPPGSHSAPSPASGPPETAVQQSVGRASQSGWLPGQRGVEAVEGMRSVLPPTVRNQL